VSKKEVRLRGWQRSAIAAAAGLCLASIVYAQQTAGSISGRATAGATVVIESPSIGIRRQTTVDPDGTYQLPQVPPGTYKVSIIRGGAAADTREVIVTAGSGATVNFGDTQVVTVTGSAVRTIDVSTVNPSFTVTKSELERIPVPGNVTGVTLLAPGTVQGDGGFGAPGPNSRATNLASINGASVAENAYYINGFNVTNINKGIAFNEVPFEAIAEVQVLNGGYGVEFGRSLGGVVSVNTKRGTNELKGGGIISWQPAEVGGIRLRGRSVHAEQSALTGRWNLIEGPGETERLSANVYFGGPIIKDKLYGFALVEGRNAKENTFGQDDHTLIKSDSPRYLAKFDWDINEKNRLELTLFSDKIKDREANYEAVSPYTTQLGTDNGTNTFTTGGQNTIVKWTGLLTDDITLSALAGRGKYSRNTNILSAGCPVVQERRVGFTPANLGCWTGSGLVDVPNASDERDAYRLDFQWALGKHTLRAGLDYEKYTTVDGSTYSGLAFHRVLRIADGSAVGSTGFTNTSGAPIDVVRFRFLQNGGTFVTKNSAWYVEDSWQATKDIVLTGGIRGESFENLNDSGGTFIKVTNTISPRAGFAWDLGGKAETKVYGNLGRYYIPVYSNTNVRLSGAENFYEEYYQFNGYSAGPTEVPILGAQLGNRFTFSDGSPKDPRTVVDPNLKPMYQDEFILGLEQALANRWTFGVKYTNRKLKAGMDDICEGDLSETWALANGYSAAQAAAIGGTISGCFLYNPGGDLVANVDLDGTGQLTPVTIPASALLMPKPTRKYDSVEFTLTRQWDKKWSASLSLVIARSRGNTEGYVKSDNQQDDAGITQDFDHPGLMEGAYGPLPNDRRYTIKANGSYALTDEWRIGGTALVQSGRPLNCFGFYSGSIPDQSIAYGASSFYCNGQLNPRGSGGRLDRTWDFGLQLQYTPMAVKGLTLKADVLNILDRRTVWGVDEQGEAGASGNPNTNYLRPRLAAIQPPRTFRFTAAYEF
jgi:outer membrane receptor protein involved in Fe transport